MLVYSWRLSDEGPSLETLDFTFRISVVHQPFIFQFIKEYI